ncbi:MAG: hypothetical protein GY950_00140 [bacterium]|nr:hypothetical protein [bacterium]
MGIELANCKITNETPTDILMVNSITGEQIKIHGPGGQIHAEKIDLNTIIIPDQHHQEWMTDTTGNYRDADCSFILQKDAYGLHIQNTDQRIIFDQTG